MFCNIKIVVTLFFALLVFLIIFFALLFYKYYHSCYYKDMERREPFLVVGCAGAGKTAFISKLYSSIHGKYHLNPKLLNYTTINQIYGSSEIIY